MTSTPNKHLKSQKLSKSQLLGLFEFPRHEGGIASILKSELKHSKRSKQTRYKNKRSTRRTRKKY